MENISLAKEEFLDKVGLKNYNDSSNKFVDWIEALFIQQRKDILNEIITGLEKEYKDQISQVQDAINFIREFEAVVRDI